MNLGCSLSPSKSPTTNGARRLRPSPSRPRNRTWACQPSSHPKGRCKSDLDHPLPPWPLGRLLPSPAVASTRASEHALCLLFLSIPFCPRVSTRSCCTSRRTSEKRDKKPRQVISPALLLPVYFSTLFYAFLLRTNIPPSDR